MRARRKWGEIDHPCYYWLACDWGKLFPACIGCSRYREHGTGRDEGAGKADRFPVDGLRPAEPLSFRVTMSGQF